MPKVWEPQNKLDKYSQNQKGKQDLGRNETSPFSPLRSSSSIWPPWLPRLVAFSFRSLPRNSRHLQCC